MVRILIVIAVVFAWVFIRFLVAYNKQRNAIAAKGGIKTIYKPLIDGLLEYRSAQIIQDKKDFITIGAPLPIPFSTESAAYGLSSFNQHSNF